MENKKIIHLYNRFGFGLTAKEIKTLSKTNFRKQLEKESLKPLNIDLSVFRNIDFRNLSREERKKIRKEIRNKVIELNSIWLNEMMNSQNHIHEKMNLFWHHHFACIIRNPLFGQQFTNIIRKHALGNFKELILEISKSAAMIDFLHMKQNIKKHPNEDFARELCELYTLGRDNLYTEQDVQNIARCFTGWKHRQNGEFFIQEKQHDEGEKTIFGKTGNFGGEDVIDLILQEKQCARFICSNIYSYFVNPNVNEKHLDELTDFFYSNNYNIKKLIIHIAESDWFYEDQNILTKIKSPVEFLVGLARQFKIRNENSKKWLYLQKLLDQVLYMPPNVKGWKVNQEWIDSNSLPLRLRLPSIILTNATLDIEAKPDYDTNPNMGKTNRITKRLGFTFDWDYFFKENEELDYKTLFFNDKISPQVNSFLNSRTFDSKQEEVIQLISLPEYQLI